MKYLTADEAFDLQTVWYPFYLVHGNKNPGANVFIPQKDYERFEQNCVKGKKTIFRKRILETTHNEILKQRRHYYRNKIK